MGNRKKSFLYPVILAINEGKSVADQTARWHLTEP